MKKIIFSIIGGLTLIALAALCIWEYVVTPYEGENPAWIYLPRNTDRTALRDSLTNALGSRVGNRVFTVYKAAASDTLPIYGAYRIEPGKTAKDIARRLMRHRQTPIKLTFNNIRTLPQLAERIAGQMDFGSDEFLAALDSVLPTAGFSKTEQYAAAFLPDTYEFYWTTSAERTVEKLLKARNDFWNDERRTQARQLGLTPVEVATVASIAEEETNNREERGEVGRLYINRIRRGMKLQADPTVKFALGDFSLRRIRGEHLKVESPYNTYRVNGLPPGPIRVAAARTIDSVLTSQPHNYIYMCAKEDFSGTHNFAADYATHLANARRYQKALNQRGIK
ncbi:MAG: endolytic transglycosylase MltG [Bacteroides sp.]|nr:endolytic transglycosylase MltG [Bacteroides sp.]MCM1379232.1 endolytic transglycosylase MltG [Bacteroides sp.]MCM1445110.1 endolytic transglycosylase MltG [Prevotella sp.]